MKQWLDRGPLPKGHLPCRVARCQADRVYPPARAGFCSKRIKTQLDELEPRTGAKPGTGLPIRVRNPIGETGRAGPGGCHSTYRRARPVALSHPGPLQSEAGVGIPESAPDGVIAKVKRRSSAWSSTRAGSLHPAITSNQVVRPTRLFAPFEAPWTMPGPGVLIVMDHICTQPSRTTGQNCGPNSRAPGIPSQPAGQQAEACLACGMVSIGVATSASSSDPLKRGGVVVRQGCFGS